MTLTYGSSDATKNDIEIDGNSPLFGAGYAHQSAQTPQFLQVPNNVLRHPEITGVVALAYAADRYRFRYGSRIDVRSLMRWTGYSRATCYRAVQAIQAFVDADGYEQPGVFDAAIGGWVKVLLADVVAFDANRAIVLGLLRRWPKRDRAIVARSGAFEVLAGELASAAGMHERTVRRILDELSTGSHRKNSTKAHYGRFELLQKRGYASYVRLFSKSEQRDRAAQLAKARRPKTAPANVDAGRDCRAGAVAAHVLSQDDAAAAAAAIHAALLSRK